MKANMGSADKITRVAIAVLLAILVYAEVLTGVLAIVSIVVAAVFVLTSLMSFCPLYTLFGFNTCKRKA